MHIIRASGQAWVIFFRYMYCTCMALHLSIIKTGTRWVRWLVRQTIITVLFCATKIVTLIQCSWKKVLSRRRKNICRPALLSGRQGSLVVFSLDSRSQIYMHVQWNLDFSNPQFLKNPDNSINQKSFPLDLFHCNFTPDILNSQFLNPIFVSLGGLRNRDSTVLNCQSWHCT